MNKLRKIMFWYAVVVSGGLLLIVILFYLKKIWVQNVKNAKNGLIPFNVEEDFISLFKN